MTYIAPSDIRFAVSPDGSFTGTCAELDDEQLQTHIQRAQDLVNGVTNVAFGDGNVPGIVRDLTLAMADFYATLAYRKGKELVSTHPVYLAYVDAQNTLKAIRAGEINFETPPSDLDANPQRRRPKVIPAWRQSAEMWPMHEFGVTVAQTVQGPAVVQDPANREDGFG